MSTAHSSILDSTIITLLKKEKVMLRFDDIDDVQERHITFFYELLYHSVNLNLEVIPGRLTENTVNWIHSLSPLNLIEVHQHGFNHTNYELSGKKSEFGPSRVFSEKLHDIESGMNILTGKFDDIFFRVFCPPWNRMDKETEEICDMLTFEGVSCFKDYVVVNKKFKNVSAIIQWPDSAASLEDGVVSLAEQLLFASRESRCINIMFHLNNMTEASFQLLRSFILLLKQENMSTAKFSEIVNSK